MSDSKVKPVDPEDGGLKKGAVTSRRVKAADQIDPGLMSEALDSSTSLEICKPDKMSWVAIWAPTRETATGDTVPFILWLLPRKAADSFGETLYYIDNDDIHRAAETYLRQFQVIVFKDLVSNLFGLWMLKITPGNSWYESVKAMLVRDDLGAYEWNITPGMKSYRIKRRPIRREVVWPDIDPIDLASRAFGESQMVADWKHPAVDFLAGGEYL